ncbi:MAG: pyruvate ferredoxin oxidoreductase [Calditrichaeota bacterium]|nr:pyruvate ferredoxin oxidoreductase [Calditrichota bacterium]
MHKILTGNQAAAWGAMCAQAQVVSAYPITPQTTIIEELADLVDKGMLKAEFIKVESEHSAMAGCIGAQAAGARTFTATSAQGLALMHELLHWAALGRLPIVMADVNRAMAPGWSIWTDQNDSLAQRDTGWLQFYCESNQEVLDTTIQAYRIAEQVDLPVMLILDAFLLSHTSEAVDVPGQEATARYLPPYKPSIYLNTKEPHAFGGIVPQDIYMEFRYKMQVAMDEALEICQKADEEYGAMFGRKYGLVDVYPNDDDDDDDDDKPKAQSQKPKAEFDVMLVTSGTVTSTARYAIDRMREQGLKVGLLKTRLLRPFPTQLLCEAVDGVPKLAVIDRNICVGMGGIWAQEIKAALYHQPYKQRPLVLEYIAGLGGRDITPEIVEQIALDAHKRDKAMDTPKWVGLKE